MHKLASSVLRIFHIDEGRPSHYYLDLLASIICILSSLVAVSALLAHKVSGTLFVAVVVFFIGLLLASRMVIPLSAALLFLGIRFAFAFLISFRWSALLAALLCLGTALVLIRRFGRNELLP